jgi:putative nucleotidyltransferase with HDIG domain
MVMIAELPLENPTLIRGTYRLQKTIRVEMNGAKRVDALLVDNNGTLRCEDWAPQYADAEFTHRLFECTLWVGPRHGGRRYARYTRAEPVQCLGLDALKRIAESHFPIPETVLQLSKLLGECIHLSITHFMEAVFTQPELAVPFFLLPASLDYHHDYPGGLAEHSIETARIAISAFPGTSVEEQALTMAAALLHDIGKVKTLTEQGQRTTEGRVMRHEHLTLELLAEPLKVLARLWPDGATALRYLLTYAPEQISRPLLPCAMAVTYADRMSASLSARRKALAQHPARHNFVSPTSKGPKSWFWKPQDWK